MLDLGLILALSQSCAPQVAPQTLAAVAYVESRFNPLAIGVNRGPAPSRRPRTPQEAAAIARALLANGANLDLGLGQINSDNLEWLGLSVDDAFEPCRNLEAAGRVLRAGYRPVGDTAAGRRSALRAALSRYNTGHPERGIRNGYVARVERAALRLSLTSPASPGLEPVVSRAEAPRLAPLPPAAWDVFARADVSTTVTFRTASPIPETFE